MKRRVKSHRCVEKERNKNTRRQKPPRCTEKEKERKATRQKPLVASKRMGGGRQWCSSRC